MLPDLPVLVQILSGVVGGAGLIAVVFLLVRGVLVTAASCDERVQTERDSHATFVTLLNDAHSNQLTALNLANDNSMKALTARLDAVIADRDAWRSAHSEEVAARHLAETATRELMESSNITMALLSALREQTAQAARTLPPEGGST